MAVKWNDKTMFYINAPGKPRVDKTKTSEAEQRYAEARRAVEDKKYRMELKRLEGDYYDY